MTWVMRCIERSIERSIERGNEKSKGYDDRKAGSENVLDSERAFR